MDAYGLMVSKICLNLISTQVPGTDRLLPLGTKYGSSATAALFLLLYDSTGNTLLSICKLTCCIYTA